MSEIEKMKKYISKYGAPRNPRYDATFNELLALLREDDQAGALDLAFTYGMAKGYRAAKAEERVQV